MEKVKKTIEERRAEFVSSLRALADLVEKNECLPVPKETIISVYPWEDNRLRAKHSIVEMVRALGKTKKVYEDNWFWLDYKLPNLIYRLLSERANVCRQETQLVTKPAEPERVIPAKPERTEEETVWICDPLLSEGSES